MKISLITVTYNADEFLETCIQSVLNQTYKDVEYIIIDGASTDSTLSIIEKFSGEIDKVVSEKDMGIYDAMNKGIALATGNVIGILNSDDFFADDNVLENIAAEFANSQADIVYGDLIYVSRLNIDKIIRIWKSSPYVKGLFQWGWMPPHPTFYVKKDIFDKHGRYNFNYNTAADYELMLRFMHKHKVKSSYIPKVFVKMRAGGVSNYSFKNRVMANIQDFKAMKLNGIRIPIITIILKPFRKLLQYL